MSMLSEGTEYRKLAAIMFTDMVGYSALAQRDEALALELLEEHRVLVRNNLPPHSGREVKTTGDGFLIEYPSALAAVQSGVAIQQAFHERNQAGTAQRQIRLRIGIHVGDVVLRDGDIHGDGVNIAARLEPLAPPGGICVSEDVARQIRNKIPHPLAVLGHAELKNIALPVVVHRVVMPWESAPASSRTSRRKRLVPALALVLVLAVLGGWWLLHRNGAPISAYPGTTVPSIPSAGVQQSEQKSVAVLPFLNLSADKADEYLSDGMTEELLNALARVKGLRVPGRSSSFAFKGRSEEDIFRKVGEQLHVSAVLEGSVRKAGDKLRITAQLINVGDGFHVWSEQYDRDMTNIFAIQSDIAARVAEALKVELLGPAVQLRKPTENIEAYKLYLQGRQLWNRRTSESITKAINSFNQALATDPAYALAYSGLADCYTILPEYSGAPVNETAPKARAAALKAIELDDSLGEPHAALGSVAVLLDWNWAAAEAELRRAIQLNPNYATAHQWLGQLYMDQGKFREALPELDRAQEIDPLSPIIIVNKAIGWFGIGQRDRAIQLLQQQVALDPEFAMGQGVLGDFYLKIGKLPEAISALEKAHQADRENAWYWGRLGFAYARSGRTLDAQRELAELERRRRLGQNFSLDIALLQHGLGNDDAALAALEQTAEARSNDLPDLFHSSLWEDLRPHPRVQTLLRQMNLVK